MRVAILSVLILAASFSVSADTIPTYDVSGTISYETESINFSFVLNMVPYEGFADLGYSPVISNGQVSESGPLTNLAIFEGTVTNANWIAFRNSSRDEFDLLFQSFTPFASDVPQFDGADIYSCFSSACENAFNVFGYDEFGVGLSNFVVTDPDPAPEPPTLLLLLMGVTTTVALKFVGGSGSVTRHTGHGALLVGDELLN